MARSLLPAIVCVLAVHAPVVSAQPAGESLAALPLLEPPSISVDAVGLLVDKRFTTPGNLSGLQIGPGPDPDTVRARFTLNPSNQSAAFTASIVMWFAPATDQTLDIACYGSVSS